jgi:hypothetical protein
MKILISRAITLILCGVKFCQYVSLPEVVHSQRKMQLKRIIMKGERSGPFGARVFSARVLCCP